MRAGVGTLNAYARVLQGFRISEIQAALSRIDDEKRPPSARKIRRVILAGPKENAAQGECDPLVSELRAHPLYRTIPDPRPAGYPSDRHLAERGPESIRIYNAIARGETRLLEAHGRGVDLENYPEIPDDCRKDVEAAFASCGVNPPQWMPREALLRAFYRGRCQVEAKYTRARTAHTEKQAAAMVADR